MICNGRYENHGVKKLQYYDTSYFLTRASFVLLREAMLFMVCATYDFTIFQNALPFLLKLLREAMFFIECATQELTIY